jgi:hypothetical protein
MVRHLLGQVVLIPLPLLLLLLLPQEEIYSSSYAAAAYLESINFNKKVRSSCSSSSNFS